MVEEEGVEEEVKGDDDADAAAGAIDDIETAAARKKAVALEASCCDQAGVAASLSLWAPARTRRAREVRRGACRGVCPNEGIVVSVVVDSIRCFFVKFSSLFFPLHFFRSNRLDRSIKRLHLAFPGKKNTKASK